MLLRTAVCATPVSYTHRANVCSLIFDVYKDFNITDYRCVLSLRDPADKKKYHDDDTDREFLRRIL